MERAGGSARSGESEPVHGQGHATGRSRTPRQYSGSGTAAESNSRYRQLIARGTRDLSVAFDLPTRRGHDSDSPLARGKVGRAGVAIDSVDDMRVLFRGIPLGKVSTSMTIDAPAAPLLLLYQLVAEEQGVPAGQLTGTIQNDVLREHIAHGTSLFPPKSSLRLTADVLRYCRAELPRWNALIWAWVMRDGFGASNTESLMPHFRPPAYATLDPCLLEQATDDVEAAAVALMAEVAALGGAAAAVELGFQRREIEHHACDVRHFRPDDEEPYVPLCVDPAVEARQIERLAKLRAWRCHERVDTAVLTLRKAAEGDDNVLYPMKDALAAGATVGEVCDALRGVWGTVGLKDDCQRVSDTKG